MKEKLEKIKNKRIIYKKVKKLINISTWAFIVITSISLIITILSTYKYISTSLMINYTTFQYLLAATMFLAGLSLYDPENRKRTIRDTVICIMLGVISLVFVFLGVQ